MGAMKPFAISYTSFDFPYARPGATAPQPQIRKFYQIAAETSTENASLLKKHARLGIISAEGKNME
jgi:hypothetical protein